MKLYVCKHCGRWAAVEPDDIEIGSTEGGVLFIEGDSPPHCLNHESEPRMEAAAAVPVADIPLTQELFAAARALVNEVDRSGTTLGAQTDAIARIRKAVGL